MATVRAAVLLLQSSTSSKPALCSPLLTQIKAKLRGSSMGFGRPPLAGVEAVTGVSGDDLPIPFVPVVSFLLPALTWERHSPGHTAPQAGSTAALRRAGWAARTIPADHFPPCLTEEQARVIPFQPLEAVSTWTFCRGEFFTGVPFPVEGQPKSPPHCKSPNCGVVQSPLQSAFQCALKQKLLDGVLQSLPCWRLD